MTGNFLSRHFSSKISKKQASDSGMALVLILLLIAFFYENTLFFKLSIPVLVMNMIFPMFFYPFAIVWLGISSLLGYLITRILFSLIFIVFVIPIGVIRRLIGKDPLQLTEFKKNMISVMKIRNKWFSPEEMEAPY
ncbi:SxtJ family membrane protein [Bacteroidota bacterium]